ncbi:MAG: nucleotidyltransferase family protein, partial [Gammaproteobacteria bacterium]|nr:nucleotidyltransferase family protein [Gammaproteobacteria bacterium]
WQTGLENGALALANHKLSNTVTKASLPKHINERLKKYAMNAAAADLGQEPELVQAFSSINKAGIPFLLIKGTPLAYSDYPQTYLRSRCDTDILFASKSDAEMAWLQLKELGYSRPNAVSGEFVSHEFTCYKKARSGISLTLDIHWKLSNRQYFARAFSFQELYDTSILIPELGEKIRALGPVHALQLACMHRIAHKPEGTANRLIWLYDIHLLGTKFTSDQWQEFISLAKEKELCGICLDGIKETKTTFATNISEAVISQLEEGARHEKQSTEMGDSRIATELSNLRALPGWKERAGLIKERVFPDANYMMEKYETQAKALLPYLYVKRALGGVFKLFR